LERGNEGVRPGFLRSHRATRGEKRQANAFTTASQGLGRPKDVAETSWGAFCVGETGARAKNGSNIDYVAVQGKTPKPRRKIADRG